MKFSIKTTLKRDYKEVYNGFDRNLFDALKPPPLMKLHVLQFDGCKKGDKVKVQLVFLGLKLNWKSIVVEEGERDGELFFVDSGTGKDLPFFLKEWRHTHRILKEGNASAILDEIEYTAGNRFFDLLLFPALYGQFYSRKPAYKSYFGKR